MKNKQAHKLLIIITGLALILSILPATGHAAIPQKINYQGYLTDPQGSPIDDTVSIAFSLYSQASGGAALWTETRSVTLTDGVFSVDLGNSTPITLPFDTQYYLGIRIGSDSEMTPRQPMTSVGYAFRAKEADSVKDNAVTTAVIANDAVTTDKISDDAISGEKIAPAAVTSTNIANGAVGSSQIGDNSVTTQDLTDDAVTVDKLSPNVISSIDGVTNDGGNVDLVAGSNVTITSDDSADTITIAASGGGSSLWSESGGNVYRDSGNVGIGTTSPQFNLSFGTDPFTPWKIALWDEVNNFYGFGLNIGRLTFFTNNTEKMTILDNGNVGIGTSSPVSKLTVEGPSNDFAFVTINQTGDPKWTGLVLNRAGTQKWFIGMSHVSDNLLFRRTASSNDMVITESGNVEIGIPVLSSAKLTVTAQGDAAGGGAENAIYGKSENYIGVLGRSVRGDAVKGVSSTGNGVYGTSTTGNGVYGISYSGYAGYFFGKVKVTGNLEKPAGQFKIDHPLDPENKYLQHSFVESPDMMNVYNGNVPLDKKGEAWVDLPDWFEVLNRDFRYQLTCIGGFAPVYIAQEISENRFKIAGGFSGMKVSWQVTGIRQDVYARAHPINVEEQKPPEEQGYYLYPELYGQTEEKGIEWARNPEMMQKIKAQREAKAQSNF
ncbi:MAG: hypothetical protein U9R17_01320 [Thermodesulfobacteriota bacterium]|nr:hypothetical protein [Thermodesulfobacteriota bacterium]